MKKKLALFGSTVAIWASMAVPALAQDYDVGGTVTEPKTVPEVIVRAPRELAFTGSAEVVLLAAIAAVLLTLGLAAIFASRRMRRSVS